MKALRRVPVSLIAVTTMLLAGCGSSTDDGDVTGGEAAQRIVSLSPSATETLWAIGAADQVIAVDGQSNYPADVPTQEALSGFSPNLEAIVAYEPDLVITADAPEDLVSGLTAAGITLLTQPAPATLDDAYGQIEQIGAATGRIGDAAELVSQMREQIEEVVRGTSPLDLTYYHELDPTLFTATGASFVGQLYSLFGLVNIADGTDPFVQLSEEFIVTADPDLIFLADVQCCGVTAETVQNRAGWTEVSAVRDGRIYELDADVASRWGPRIVDMVVRIGDIVNEDQPADAHN